ncbi:MAG TPA: hypothetical protein VIW94_09815 [Acidimicrobiia bacterium]
MARATTTPPHKGWSVLEKYRERYNLDAEIPGLVSLKRSIDRRLQRRAALNRRLGDLARQVAEAESQLKAVNSEILGARQAGVLLLNDVIDRVRQDKGEGWSPTPVFGFRAWHFHNGMLYGAKLMWQRPEMTAECLHHIPGEDLPHSAGRCGPPPCGVYAVKDLDILHRELGTNSRSILGVVAMTGKVIEHELGYRAANSTVVAIAGRIGEHRFALDRSDEIEALFANPVGEAGRREAAAIKDPDRYLIEWKEENDIWTWEKS